MRDATKYYLFGGEVATEQGETALSMGRGKFRRRGSHCHWSSLCLPLSRCYLTAKQVIFHDVPGWKNLDLYKSSGGKWNIKNEHRCTPFSLISHTNDLRYESLWSSSSRFIYPSVSTLCAESMRRL